MPSSANSYAFSLSLFFFFSSSIKFLVTLGIIRTSVAPPLGIPHFVRTNILKKKKKHGIHYFSSKRKLWIPLLFANNNYRIEAIQWLIWFLFIYFFTNIGDCERAVIRILIKIQLPQTVEENKCGSSYTFCESSSDKRVGKESPNKLL